MRVLVRAVCLTGDGTGVLFRQWVRWLAGNKARGAFVRGFGSLCAVWMVGSMCFAAPVLMWVVAGSWCAAAIRAARLAERRAAAEEAFLDFIDANIGDRNGVHLAVLLGLLHRDKLLTHLDQAGLREQIEARKIRVRDSVKIGGTVMVGVHRDDFPRRVKAPLPPADSPSPTGSSAGHYPTTPEKTPIVEGVAWTVHAPVGERPAAEPEPADDGFEDHLADALDVLGGGDRS
ncbi:hypothetical protein [Streptomyces sp. MI02-7b]|uniref:hypothetical protein n=1 Tax=Streptomyces sp. MI02-7b TaxID=462941 RepID=UPI0029AC4D0E|nr:hypothetical protein [Streptomyces sp. MI02-7b]MDX3074607.1 hypothetical protein [Streptomyces sp. MI02-7b]